jgi:hypothetical protein
VEDLEAVVDELAANGVSFERYDEPRIITDEKGIAVVDGGKGAWLRIPTAICSASSRLRSGASTQVTVSTGTS